MNYADAAYTAILQSDMASLEAENKRLRALICKANEAVEKFEGISIAYALDFCKMPEEASELRKILGTEDNDL